MSVEKKTHCGITAFYSTRIGVTHGFTTRGGGVSIPPFDELNFGFNRSEPRENIEENFKRLSHAFGFPYESIAIVNYEHGSHVECVTMKDCGAGFFKSLPPCDGLVTNDPAVTLITLHADCSAFFIYDPVKQAIGLAHAGHKGVRLRIGAHLVEQMTKRFGSDPRDMLALLGPTISPKHFEVDYELGRSFIDEFNDEGCCLPGAPGKLMLNLHRPMTLQLVESGIMLNNIDAIKLCTFENRELFYSYRRDHGQTGAMAAFMRLCPPV